MAEKKPLAKVAEQLQDKEQAITKHQHVVIVRPQNQFKKTTLQTVTIKDSITAVIGVVETQKAIQLDVHSFTFDSELYTTKAAQEWVMNHYKTEKIFS